MRKFVIKHGVLTPDLRFVLFIYLVPTQQSQQYKSRPTLRSEHCRCHATCNGTTEHLLLPITPACLENTHTEKTKNNK